jgi:hypothetical protein
VALRGALGCDSLYQSESDGRHTGTGHSVTRPQWGAVAAYYDSSTTWYYYHVTMIDCTHTHARSLRHWQIRVSGLSQAPS